METNADGLMKSEIAASVLIVLGFVNWGVLRSRPWVRLASSGVFLSLLTFVVYSIVGSPFQPHFGSASVEETLWQQAIVVVWWFLAARWIVRAVRATLLDRIFAGEGRLLSDLLAGLIYLFALLTVISTTFDLPVRGLLATSGVVAILLGLALQSTLADVFSGIAIGIERPYSVGDRIWMEGPVEGTIVQINWRAIRIQTDSNDIATIPHSLAAKSRVINRSIPTSQRSDSVHFTCAASVAPEDVAEMVHRALLLCPKILSKPKPAVALTRIGKRSNDYEIGISVGHSRDLWESKSTLLKQILRQFRAANIQSYDRRDGEKPPQEPGRRQLFGKLPLFRMLSEDQLEGLCQQVLERDLRPDERLFSQGDGEGSLFVIVSGVMEVSSTIANRATVIGRITAGDYIGEIGLLTGAPHAGTVTALTECTVLELRKEHLAPLLAEDPRLVQAFEESARRGQALYDRSVAASIGSEAVPPGQLLSRIREYFRNFVHS
jgi:small-conductance mechanosensitive channel